MSEKKFEIINKNGTDTSNWNGIQDYVHETLFSLDYDRYDVERELDVIGKLNIGDTRVNHEYTIKRIE